MYLLTRLTYVASGFIYMSWVIGILIGFWYIDIYQYRFPLYVEIGVTVPAIVLAFMAYSFIQTGFSKSK